MTLGGGRGRDHRVVRFTTTCAISIGYHLSCEFESHPWRGVPHATLCDKVCQALVTGTPVSSIDKPDRYDMNETLLKVALNTITLTLYNSVTSTVYLISVAIVLT